MRDHSHIEISGASQKCLNPSDDLRATLSDNENMAGVTKTKSNNHLRSWRRHRRMTQAKLGELAGTTANMISQLESGVRGLSDKWLLRLAPPLGTTPGALLDQPPSEADMEWASTISGVKPGERAKIIAIIKALKIEEGDN